MTFLANVFLKISRGAELINRAISARTQFQPLTSVSRFSKIRLATAGFSFEVGRGILLHF